MDMGELPLGYVSRSGMAGWQVCLTFQPGLYPFTPSPNPAWVFLVHYLFPSTSCFHTFNFLHHNFFGEKEGVLVSTCWLPLPHPSVISVVLRLWFSSRSELPGELVKNEHFKAPHSENPVQQESCFSQASPCPEDSDAGGLGTIVPSFCRVCIPRTWPCSPLSGGKAATPWPQLSWVLLCLCLQPGVSLDLQTLGQLLHSDKLVAL